MEKRAKWVATAMACSMALSACASSGEGARVQNEAAAESSTKAQELQETGAVTEASEAATEASSQEVSDSMEKEIKKPEPIVNPAEPHEPVDTEIFVKKIDGLSEDFICGMDASSVLVEENSGVN